MKLIKAPNKWLHTKVNPFDFEVQDAEKITQQMVDLMLEEGGLGLSANQVELDSQIFVMRPTLLDSRKPIEIINPVITSVSEEVETGPEGCLSYPQLWLDIKRPVSISAKYFDKTHTECTITLYDLDARCFLHEYDHLQGITFTDRVSRLKLDRATKKQKKVQKHG